jgi:hypothetical protein
VRVGWRMKRLEIGVGEWTTTDNITSLVIEVNFKIIIQFNALLDSSWQSYDKRPSSVKAEEEEEHCTKISCS